MEVEEKGEEEERDSAAPINAEMIQSSYFECGESFWSNGTFIQRTWVASASRSWKTAKPLL